MKNHIALIGLSGTGKSTVARILAQHPARAWADTDALIVARTSRQIADIFASDGETAFRDMETEVLQTLLLEPSRQRYALATGGGIILRAENRDLLRTHAYVVWLDAPVETLLQRLAAHAERRPLLAGEDPRRQLETLRATRAPLYHALADQMIDTDGLSPEQIAALIEASLERLA